MLNTLNNLSGYKLRATDGDLGKVDEFYFDDQTWFIRYLIVQTGKWLADRRVLISPVSVGHPDPDSKTISVSLTSERVRNSPEIDTKKPVYRQHEEELSAYYNWPMYWQPGMSGNDTYVMPVYPPLIETPDKEQKQSEKSDTDDPHLRSSRQITGYYIHAVNGEIGHVDDFIVDDEIWKISYLVVKTKNWLPSKKVLISPEWIREINWADETVYIDLSREEISESPEFDPSEPLNAEYENALKNHYHK